MNIFQIMTKTVHSLSLAHILLVDIYQSMYENYDISPKHCLYLAHSSTIPKSFKSKRYVFKSPIPSKLYSNALLSLKHLYPFC